MASTLVMVKTVCCESFKICGKRCSLCPHRPENREALEAYRAAVRTFSLSRDRTASAAAGTPPQETLTAP